LFLKPRNQTGFYWWLLCTVCKFSQWWDGQWLWRKNRRRNSKWCGWWWRWTCWL